MAKRPNIDRKAIPMEENFDGLKVMVIDDSKTIRRTAETLLQKAGCTVITATDGFDALAKIADSNPDIIFVDIMMPRLDGYQTCALIKNNSAFKSTPVIMLSSKDGLFDKKIIFFWLQCTVVNCLWLLYLTKRPLANVFRRSETDS